MSPTIRPELQYPQLWICMGLIIALLIAVTCLMPAQDLPAIGLSDKAKHGLSYLLLAFWFASIVQRRNVLALVAMLLAFGGLIEIAQEWMQLGRHAELADLGANAVGIAAGVALAITPLGRWVDLLESGYIRMRA